MEPDIDRRDDVEEQEREDGRTAEPADRHEPAEPAQLPEEGSMTEAGEDTRAVGRDRDQAEREAGATTAEAPTAGANQGGVPEEVPENPLEALVTDSRVRYTERWEQIKAGFVDEPRRAVEDADRLVAEVVDQVARACADERERLARSWSSDQPDTEAMRTTLLRYRRLFGFALR
jgi:hypothetical protein